MPHSLSNNPSDTDGWTAPPVAPRVKICVTAVLLLTLITALIWSHFRLFWVDELLEFYTDSKPSVGQILWGQLHAPFSLEPPLFHIVLHFMLRVLPSHELAARLVSILSLLITELCAFLVTKSLSRRDLVALLAMTLPFFLVSVDYAPEARIYSLQLAALSVSVLCYQRITLGSPETRWKLLLTASIAAAVLTHYSAVLTIVPFWLAEAVRTVQRKRVDVRTALAIFLASALSVLNLPFTPALRVFRSHYYAGESSWRMIPFTYLWFKYHFAAYQLDFDHSRRVNLLGIAILLFVVATIVSAFRRYRATQLPIVVALSVAALIPILNVAAAQFTRAYVPRYSLPAIFGIAVLTAAFLGEFLAETGLSIIVSIVLGWSCFYAFGQIRMFRAWRDRARQARLTEAQAHVLSSLNDRKIYVQDSQLYFALHYYRGQPFQGLVSASCELKWNGQEAGSLFAKNMAATAGVPFSGFSVLYRDGEPHMILTSGDGVNDWLYKEIAADGGSVRPLGFAFGGQLEEVRFLKGQGCE